MEGGRERGGPGDAIVFLFIFLKIALRQISNPHSAFATTGCGARQKETQGLQIQRQIKRPRGTGGRAPF